MERRVIIGTAGHIDHGKTALVRALTGVDTDRLPEEKRRGITIDLGFAPLPLESLGTIGIVDVPGHEDFVRSMVVGATGIDLGLLVIAADEGIMPQTREHFLILQLLEVPRIVVALTKADLVDADWLALVRADVETLFLDNASPLPPIVACSSRTGDGLADLRSAIAEGLLALRPRSTSDLFRLPVDRVFTVKGTGTVVTGTVWSGEIASEGVVRVLPGETRARVRRVEQHGLAVSKATAGGRAAIALAGVEVGDVPRGRVLVSDDSWSATTLFEAGVTIAPENLDKLSSRTELRLHAGTSEVGARMSAVADGTASPHLARITTDEPIVLRGGDRFVLRLPAPVRTIGGGVVLDPYARRRALSGLPPAEVRQLARSADARLKYVLERAGSEGVPIGTVPVRVGCAPDEVFGLVALTRARATMHNLFDAAAVERVMASVQRIVAEYEIKSPLSRGIPARTLRERLRASEELADVSIMELERAGKIETSGPVIRRKGWVPSPTDADLSIGSRLAHDICASGREPPSASELASRYGSSVPALLHFLERQGQIVQVEEDRYYDRNAVDVLVAKLRKELVPGRPYAPAQLRDVLGFSRKYLIPFLEFCDRVGITERHGDGRIIRQTPDFLLDSPTAQS